MYAKSWLLVNRPVKAPSHLRSRADGEGLLVVRERFGLHLLVGHNVVSHLIGEKPVGVAEVHPEPFVDLLDDLRQWDVASGSGSAVGTAVYGLDLASAFNVE